MEKIEYIKNAFIKLGYKEEKVNGETLYIKNNDYCKFSYVKDFHGYVIEIADCLENANKNLFEDVDVIDENIKVEEIETELRKMILN